MSVSQNQKAVASDHDGVKGCMPKNSPSIKCLCQLTEVCTDISGEFVGDRVDPRT